MASTQDEHFASGMAPFKDSVVIFGGSSNSDGSTELFQANCSKLIPSLELKSNFRT